MALVRYNEVYI